MSISHFRLISVILLLNEIDFYIMKFNHHHSVNASNTMIDLNPYVYKGGEPLSSIEIYPVNGGLNWVINVDIGPISNQTTLPLIVDTGTYDIFVKVCSNPITSSSSSSPTTDSLCLDENKYPDYISLLSPSYIESISTVTTVDETSYTMIEYGIFGNGIPIFIGNRSTTVTSDYPELILGTPFAANSKDLNAIEYWNNTGGQFGMMTFWQGTDNMYSLFYNLLALPNITQEVITNSSSITNVTSMDYSKLSYLSLDFNLEDKSPSYLHLNGVDSKYTSSLIWSQMYRIPTISLYDAKYFNIFHLSVCNIDVLANYSSNWLVLIDTGAQFLTLPKEFLQSIVNWVPSIYCVFHNNYCFVDGNIVSDISNLPPLTFQLSEKGEKLYIYFEQLVIATNYTDDYINTLKRNPNDKRIAIRQGSSINEYGQGKNLKHDNIDTAIGLIRSLQLNNIVFGSSVLRSLYVAFDIQSRTIGLATKSTSSSSSSSSSAASTISSKGSNNNNNNNNNNNYCTATAKYACKGDSIYYAQQNICLPPDCSKLFFQHLDVNNMECRYNTNFLVASFALLLLFSGGEWFLLNYYLHLSATSKISALRL